MKLAWRPWLVLGKSSIFTNIHVFCGYHSRFAPQRVVERGGEGEGAACSDVDLVQGEAVFEDGLRNGAALLAIAVGLILDSHSSLLALSWFFSLSGLVLATDFVFFLASAMPR